MQELFIAAGRNIFVHKGIKGEGRLWLTSGNLFDPMFFLCKGHPTLVTFTTVDIIQPLTCSERSALTGQHQEASPRLWRLLAGTDVVSVMLAGTVLKSF